VCWHIDTGVLEQQTADVCPATQKDAVCSPSLPQIQPLIHTSWYHKSVLYSALGHMGGCNTYGRYTLMAVVRHTLANGALIYPSQGGQYRAECCMALG
jgi:hypothetical protein